MPSYIATYIVTNGIISVSTDGTQQLSTVIGQKVYLYVSLTETTQCVINLTNYMLFEKNLVYTTELQNIASSLTDFQIAGYTSTDIPLQDQNLGGYGNRLVTYDAYTTSDVNVSWTSIYTPSVVDDNYQRDELNDLVITSNTKNFSNCLVSVNGVFHKTYFFQNDLYVQNGFANIKTSKQNRVSIYDTTSLGGHYVLPITEENIDTSNNAFFSGVTLTFPNTNFTGMTVLLVLAGYLYVLDGNYEIININRILINTCKIDLLHQFLDDPNTSYVLNNYAVVAEDTSIYSAPQIADEITYYLESVYPNTLENQIAPVNFIDFSAITPDTGQPGYTPPTYIVDSLPMSDFTDPRWVKSLLTQINSF